MPRLTNALAHCSLERPFQFDDGSVVGYRTLDVVKLTFSNAAVRANASATGSLGAPSSSMTAV